MIGAVSTIRFDYRNTGSAMNRPAPDRAQRPDAAAPATERTAPSQPTNSAFGTIDTAVSAPLPPAPEGDSASPGSAEKSPLPRGQEAGKEASGPEKSEKGEGSQTELSDDEQRELQELKQRDREVRKHEQAHKAAAGRHATGAASFSYQAGPDGRRYAIGGEVSIDLSKGRTPEETIQKADSVRAAALAPAEPSSQDRKVAAEAARMAQTARAEIAAQSDAESDENAPAETAPEIDIDNTAPAGPSSAAPPPLSPFGGSEPSATEGRSGPGVAARSLFPNETDGPMSASTPNSLTESFTKQLPELAPKAETVSNAYRNNLPTSAISTGDVPNGTATLNLSA